ncbi:alpha/beta hydrolase [Streptococcus parauberis]|uniref:alpha/beta hydrolase n=1 Tax=Streptococcus parauberis TaxID=1348 RepID=UPI000CCDED34|nr:alpha/beta hydrolase [Streptococcus parauberis]PNY18915.1 Carboxylesterase NlhH [Streptococcus parauberis]
MTIIKKLAFVLLECAVLVLLVFNLATLFPIPYLGSIANHYTVPYIRLWLPLMIILFIASLVFSLRHRSSRWHLTNLLLAALCLGIGLYIIISIQTSLNQLGAGVSFFRSYQAEETSGVDINVETYDKTPLGHARLNVYQVDDGKKNKPVLIFIHGGGWIAGHRNSHAYYWESFAKSGYVVVSLDYDLSSKHRHLSDVTERQLTKGFAWVQNNIEDYGGSTKNLFVTGVSAGGNLALELAYKINNGKYRYADDTRLPKIDAVSVAYPVADPRAFYENSDRVKGDLAKYMAVSYLGGRPDQLPKKYSAITPKNFISKKTPPCLFISGARDSLVPQESTYELAEQLTEKLITNKLVIVPYTNHAYDRVDGNLGSQAYLKLSKDWFKEIMENKESQ